eukprot:5224098-Prymnesium_polylepis.1
MRYQHPERERDEVSTSGERFSGEGLGVRVSGARRPDAAGHAPCRFRVVKASGGGISRRGARAHRLRHRVEHVRRLPVHLGKVVAVRARVEDGLDPLGVGRRREKLLELRRVLHLGV